MIYKVGEIIGITEEKHESNNIHKKKEHSENSKIKFQSILDTEKKKYDERIIYKNIK